jgi:hypothetical protein
MGQSSRFRLSGVALPAKVLGVVWAAVLMLAAFTGLPPTTGDPWFLLPFLWAVFILVRAPLLGVWVVDGYVTARSWFRSYRFVKPTDVTSEGYDGFARWDAGGPSPYLQVLRIVDSAGEARGLTFTVTTPKAAKRQAKELRRMLNIVGREPLESGGRHRR